MKTFLSLVTLFVSFSFFEISAEEFSASNVQGPSSLHPGALRKGFYTGLSTGKIFFTSSERSLYSDGWVVGFKAGYDVWKYLGIEGIFKFSAHSSTSGSPLANTPPSFFVYQMIGQIRGAYPILSRLYIQMAGGGGLYFSSPNQNTNNASNLGMFYGEIGLEYFMRSRGISIGLDPSIAIVQNFDGAVIQATGFLRYTF